MSLAQQLRDTMGVSDEDCLMLDAAERIEKLEYALQRIRDCDFVITLPDRMNAVRAIAEEALKWKKGKMIFEHKHKSCELMSDLSADLLLPGEEAFCCICCDCECQKNKITTEESSALGATDKDSLTVDHVPDARKKV